MLGAGLVLILWQSKQHCGFLLSPSMSSARIQLHRRGILPQSMTRQRPWHKKKLQYSPTTRAHLMRSLSTTLSVGMALDQALILLAKGEKSLWKKALWYYIAEQIQQGQSLADSLIQFPQQFDRYTTTCIHTGETSGQLALVLTQLADHFSRIAKTQAQVIKALLYPLTVLFIGLLVIAVLCVYVMPSIQGMFSRFNANLPALTEMVLTLSSSLQHYGPQLLMLFTVCAIGIIWLYRRYPIFPILLTRIGLRLPLIKEVISTQCALQISQLLALTLSSGMPLHKALTL